MTKRNKCDSCRTAKCDEKEPMCTRCLQKGFNCVRTYGQVTNFRFIFSDSVREFDARTRDTNDPCDPTHRKARLAKGAKGQRQHQSDSSRSNGSQSPRLPLPSNMPQSPAASLAARWIHMLQATAEPNGEHPIGQFTFCKDLIPLRIGRSDALDQAVGSVLDMLLAFANRDFEARELATRVSLPGSARSVRLELNLKGSLDCGTDVLLAMKMLHLAELFRSSHIQFYIFHARALWHMVKQRQALAKDDLDRDIEARMFSEMMVEDFVFSTHAGEDSMYDASAWLDLPAISLETPCGLEVGPFWKATQSTFIQIPKLVRLVRAALEDPQDETVVIQALNLARSLYNNDQGSWVDQFTDLGHISTVPSVAAEVKSVVPSSYIFSPPEY